MNNEIDREFMSTASGSTGHAWPSASRALLTSPDCTALLWLQWHFCNWQLDDCKWPLHFTSHGSIKFLLKHVTLRATENNTRHVELLW